MQATKNVNRQITDGRVARIGLALAGWSEKWFPDPLIFAFLGVLVVYGLGIVAGESPIQGQISYWRLTQFASMLPATVNREAIAHRRGFFLWQSAH